jgi:crotonobetainyl-CoA:carnitine CoA-transferase CaiB-like acyl-CoA transferase
MSFKRPYEGIKVVDLSQGIAGPYCAMLLAQWGADVIKVEPPDGDWARMLGPRYGDHTAFSVVGNLGKRCVVLDLKEDEAKAALREIIKGADVFLEGFRPGVIERLGFGFEEVKALAPSVIYVSISGYGQTGPLSQKPGMDPILQAYTGFMRANADKEGTPLRAQPIIVDTSTGLYAQQAVAAALYAKRDDPQPRFLDISLMGAAANLQGVRFASTVQEGAEPPQGSTPGGVYQCGDGFIQIIVLKEKDWLTFCDALGLDDFKADMRYRDSRTRVADLEIITARITPIFASRTAAEWGETFTALGLMNQPIMDYIQFSQEPQALETGLVARLPQPGYPEPPVLLNIPGHPLLQPGERRAVAPTLGRDTRVVLREAGIADDAIEGMISSGKAYAID